MFFSKQPDTSDLRLELRAIRQEQAAQRTLLEAIAQELGITTVAIDASTDQGPTWAAGDPWGMPPGVVEAIESGRKIEAIKQYREATGLGLKEAKDMVEAWARHNGH